LDLVLSPVAAIPIPTIRCRLEPVPADTWEALVMAQVEVRVLPADPMGDRVDPTGDRVDLVVEWGAPIQGEVPTQADSQSTDLRLPS